MLFEPRWFIDFIESNDIPVIGYIDNWAEGQPKYYFLSDELVINMTYCIDIDIAHIYLKKIEAERLSPMLDTLECPCENR